MVCSLLIDLDEYVFDYIYQMFGLFIPCKNEFILNDAIYILSEICKHSDVSTAISGAPLCSDEEENVGKESKGH